MIPQDFVPELKLQPSAIKGVNIIDKQELKLPKIANHGQIRCAQDYFYELESDVDRVPQRQLLNLTGTLKEMTTIVSRNKENIVQPSQEGTLDPKKLRGEINELKKNLIQSQELNTKLHEHLTALTANYHADLANKHQEITGLRASLSNGQPFMPTATEEDRVSKVYKLLSSICQTNYQYMQQNVMKYSLNSNSSSSSSTDKLQAEIKDLKEQLAAAKDQAKSDHVKYVNQLHEVYRKEIEKVAGEKSDLQVNYQACAAKLEELRGHLRQLEDTIHSERQGKVQALNELTFKRIEVEKIHEDHLQKVRDIRKQYEERVCNLQKEIIERDS